MRTYQSMIMEHAKILEEMKAVPSDMRDTSFVIAYGNLLRIQDGNMKDEEKHWKAAKRVLKSLNTKQSK